MTRLRLIATILPATLIFCILAAYLNLFANIRVYAAYDDGRNSNSSWIVAFYHSSGWPFQSYEFVEGQLYVLGKPRDKFNLKQVTWDQYLSAYGNEYSTGCTNALEDWKIAGIAGNTLVAALPCLTVLGLTLLWLRDRSKLPIAQKADNPGAERADDD